MRLSLYSDLSLRALLYLAGVEDGRLVSTGAVAERFQVSAFHLQKVIHGLRRFGLVESVAGRKGGLRLARPPESIRLGELLARIEGAGALVDCARGPCPLCGACTLKETLDQAERAFYDVLDRFTLADIARDKTLAILRRLVAS